jgi:hypothetical protein
MAIPFLACMLATASYYHLPPRALPAILATEGGEVHVASRNTDGTEDLGPMQVNTIWVPMIARAAGQDAAQTRQRLLDEPCFNIAAAGAILRLELTAARGNLQVAIGHYHSHTPARAAAYRRRVASSAMRLYLPPDPATPAAGTAKPRG